MTCINYPTATLNGQFIKTYQINDDDPPGEITYNFGESITVSFTNPVINFKNGTSFPGVSELFDWFSIQPAKGYTQPNLTGNLMWQWACGTQTPTGGGGRCILPSGSVTFAGILPSGDYRLWYLKSGSWNPFVLSFNGYSEKSQYLSNFIPFTILPPVPTTITTITTSTKTTTTTTTPSTLPPTSTTSPLPCPSTTTGHICINTIAFGTIVGVGSAVILICLFIIYKGKKREFKHEYPMMPNESLANIH